MRIMITGTPGVGKTRLSEHLSSKYKLKHIVVSDLIVEKKLYTNYCKELDTFDFDPIIVDKFLKRIKENIIIDSHVPEIGESNKLDCVIVLKCPIEILSKRLQERGYSKEKVKVNVDCEIFEEIENDVYDIYEKNIIHVIEPISIDIDYNYIYDKAEKIIENIIKKV